MSMEEGYTLAQLAEMTGLSTRTLRSCLRRGTLSGTMVRGAWQFSPAQFEAFLKTADGQSAARMKSMALLNDFLAEKKAAPSACAVIDLPDLTPEAEARLRAQLAALDDASLQAALYNEFENRLSRLGELPVASREEIGSVYGGWEAME